MSESLVRTKIVEVSVYTDRARIKRRGTVTVEEGIHTLEIAQLPLNLDSSSLRASGTFKANTSTAEAQLLSVNIHKVFYQETPDTRIKELEDQIQLLEDEDQAHADKIDALKVQATFAHSVAEKAGEQLARGVAFSRSDITQGSALMNFIAQETERTQEGIRQTSIERRTLDKKLDALRAELQAMRSQQGRERYTASIEIDASTSGELTLDLIYDVAGASWNPLYDIRLNNDSIELTYLAEITQRTGEDWHDAALILSTARPILAAVLPELKPWYITVYQPPVRPPVQSAILKQRTSAVAGMLETTAGDAEIAAVAAAAPAPVALKTQTAEVQSEGASVTFKLAQNANIPADGEPHKVTVATAQFDPQLDHIAVPKLAEFAYRRAKVKNSSDLILLPGKTSLFVEGDYIGNTTLKLIAPGEEFDLYLGVDDRVYVKRELKSREVDKKRLQDKRRLHYGYEIEVRNLRNDAIKLEVHDQLPVARHESIKVKLDSSEPKPDEKTELNELTWQLSLAPDAKQLIRFDFQIEHPRDITVTGLP